MITRDEMISFSLEIEKIMTEKKIGPIDAVLLYCEETGFEIEIAAKLVSGSLKSKIKIEAENLNFLTKSSASKLPF